MTRLAGILLAAVIGLGVAVVVLALAGRPGDCGMGRDLAKARMLEPAAAALDEGDCADADIGAVSEDQKRATRAFARAGVYSAAGTAARATAEASGAARKTRAMRRARGADTQTMRSLVDGLNLDPFRPGEAAALTAVIDQGGEAHTRRSAVAVCRVGADMISVGLLDEAEKLLGLAVLRGRRQECALVVLRLQATRVAAAVEARRARAAESEEDAEQAREHHANALRVDTSLTTSKDALAAAAADRGSALDDVADRLGEIPGWLSSSWERLLVLFVGLLIAAALTFAALRHLAWRRRGFADWLAPKDGSSRLGRRIARLNVRVADFDGGADDKLAGKDVSTLLACRLDQPTAGGFVFDRVPSTVETEPLKGLTDLLAEVPHGKVVAALITLTAPLFAPRSAKVDGRLLPADGGGHGLAVAITGPQKEMSSALFRERLIDPAPGGQPAERWGRLVPPATVWARHHLRSLTAKQYADQAPPEAWRAEALAEAGSEWYAAQDWPRAATCYARALAADESLLPALNNLAVVQIRLGEYALAIQLLDNLLLQLDAEPQSDELWPALLEATLYNLILAIVYLLK